MSKYVDYSSFNAKRCEELMEATGCDLETAMREYNFTFYPETYNAEDYE